MLLIDTGAVATLWSEDFFNIIKDKTSKLTPISKELIAADQRKLQIIATTTIIITIFNPKVNHNVYIAKAFAYNFVIGNDFMRNNYCNILYNSEIFIINRHSTPIHHNIVITDFTSIVTSDNYTLNKHEEARLPCERNDLEISIESCNTLLLKCNQSTVNKYRVQFARVIVNAATAGNSILVANTTNQNITIPKSTNVATITKCTTTRTHCSQWLTRTSRYKTTTKVLL